jgi:hypothetical protein
MLKAKNVQAPVALADFYHCLPVVVISVKTALLAMLKFCDICADLSVENLNLAMRNRSCNIFCDALVHLVGRRPTFKNPETPDLITPIANDKHNTVPEISIDTLKNLISLNTATHNFR